MRAIYEPRGKALEYAFLAVNLYDGCPHGCTYCYGPTLKKVSREDFLSCKPRLGILNAIERDAKLLSGDARRGLLCFTCAPYPPSDQKPFSCTREAIKILKANNLRVTVLTKGGMRATRDFDLLTPEDKFGCTLTFTAPHESVKWEPHAAPPEDRLFSLRDAHMRGIQTWASLEPVIDDNAVLQLIAASHWYVDHYKIGKMNHQVDLIHWPSFGPKLLYLLKSIDSGYYIKNDTLPLMPPGTPQRKERTLSGRRT